MSLKISDMTMTLTFNLPEEREEAHLAMNAGELLSDVKSFTERLRMYAKHSDDPEEVKHAKWAQDIFSEEFRYNIERFEL
jgi:hypothetical protein